VPALVVVGIVNSHLYFQLGLSPKAGAVWRRQSDSGIEVRQLELSVIANQIYSGLVIRVFTKIIVRLELKAHLLLTRHLVGGGKLQPISAGTHAIRFSLIGTHGATLGASQYRHPNHKEQENASYHQSGPNCRTKPAQDFQVSPPDNHTPTYY